MDSLRFGTVDESCLIKATKKEADCEWLDQPLDRAEPSSTGVGSVEQNVQKKSVASQEAHSTERGSGSVERQSSRLQWILFLVRICSDYAIMWCITLLFIVMFIVIVNQDINWDVTCEFMVIYEGILRVMNILPINRIHHSQ